MTVNGAMSLLTDSMVCALGPLICLTSFVPELKGMEADEMVRRLILCISFISTETESSNTVKDIVHFDSTCNLDSFKTFFGAISWKIYPENSLKSLCRL